MSGEQLVLTIGTPDDLVGVVALEGICSSHPWREDAFLAPLRGESGSCVLVLRRIARKQSARMSHGMQADSKEASGAEAGGIIGSCVLQTVADELHVHNLCIHPERRRRGLGRWLLDAALHLAARRGAQRAILEVRAGNLEARRLYAASGFRCIARRADYYARPVEDALVMEKNV